MVDKSQDQQCRRFWTWQTMPTRQEIDYLLSLISMACRDRNQTNRAVPTIRYGTNSTEERENTGSISQNQSPATPYAPPEDLPMNLIALHRSDSKPWERTWTCWRWAWCCLLIGLSLPAVAVPNTPAVELAAEPGSIALVDAMQVLKQAQDHASRGLHAGAGLAAGA